MLRDRSIAGSERPLFVPWPRRTPDSTSSKDASLCERKDRDGAPALLGERLRADVEEGRSVSLQAGPGRRARALGILPGYVRVDGYRRPSAGGYGLDHGGGSGLAVSPGKDAASARQ